MESEKLEKVKVTLVQSGGLSGLRIASLPDDKFYAIGFMRNQFEQVCREKLIQTADGAYVRINSPAVYILISEEKSLPTAYIGQGENVVRRLNQHIKAVDKDWWRDTIILISSAPDDPYQTQTEYVESILIKKAQEHSNSPWKLANQQTKKENPLTKQQHEKMEKLADNAEILLRALGCNLFRDLGKAVPNKPEEAEAPVSHAELPFPTSTADDRSGDDPRPQLEVRGVTRFTAKSKGIKKYGHYYEAQMEPRGKKEFVVLAGSKIRLNEGLKIPRQVAERRRELRKDGTLKKDREEGVWVLERNETFNSRSTTAKFVLAISHDGRGFWELPNGTYYEDWAESNKVVPNSRPEISFPTFTAESKSRGYGNYYEAQMEQRGIKKFVVLAGSKIRLKQGSLTFHEKNKKIVKRRHKLKEEGVLVEEEGVLMLERDEPFESKSAAAGFVCTSIRSGPAFWS